MLGGGGSTGNAWLIGVVAGLSSAGLDVADADLTVGTSAGSTAAAQLAGATPAELFADILRGTPARPGAPAGATTGRPSNRPVVDHLARTRQIIDSSDGPANLRRNLGAAALERAAGSDGSWQTQWRPGCGAGWRGRDRRTGRLRPVERGRPGRRGRRELFQRSAVRHRGAALHRRRIPHQCGERRPRHRVRPGARAVAVRGQVARPCPVGHASRGAGRGAPRHRQHRDDDLAPERRRTALRRECHGWLAAAGGSARGVRPGCGDRAPSRRRLAPGRGLTSH